MIYDGFIEIRYVPDKYSGKNELVHRIALTDKIREVLSPLSRDREIMEEMRFMFPAAYAEHIRNKKQAEKRHKMIKDISHILAKALTDMIESQDTINGYKQEDI